MTSSEDQKAVLGRFLADNPELEQLSSRLATFNVFSALKVGRVEIRHSNTLGWLLDPSESHGLRDIVLRRILSNILLDRGTAVEGVSAATVELMSFRNIEVRREWRQIDVLVIDRENKLLVLIENKIKSGESKNQLAKYLDIVKREFPDFKILPVFLTLEGQPSKDDDACEYISYSHAQVLLVLERILRQRSSQIPEAVVMFLEHYLDTLRRLTMQDDDLTELCRTIYRQHRAAIDLIVEYGMVSAFTEAVSNALDALGDHEILHRAAKSVWFLPASWAKIVPENGIIWTFLKRSVSVCCWIEQTPTRSRLIFEVSDMKDPELRMACVKALRDEGFKLTNKAFEEGTKCSRFYTSSQTVSDWTNEQKVADAVGKLFAKAEPYFEKTAAVFRKVFKT